ncbi:hypothetical protein FGB62_20g215 [Gracilaria domingensis]|nr:hypothetical protein FGB62_20g215 [Gracilaria domingensis]
MRTHAMQGQTAALTSVVAPSTGIPPSVQTSAAVPVQANASIVRNLAKSSETGHSGREANGIYDTLFAAANDTNPTEEADGTNHDCVMSILQAALAQEDIASDDDTLTLNDQLPTTLLCESDNAHDQFASHEGYDEEDNDIAQEGHIHHAGFLAEFADDYANDVVNNDDVPHF